MLPLVLELLVDLYLDTKPAHPPRLWRKQRLAQRRPPPIPNTQLDLTGLCQIRRRMQSRRRRARKRPN